MRLLQWTLKAAIFLILLAFALNNKEDVAVRFLWGLEWRAPMVLVLLVVFALGVAVGVLGMVPRWWRQRSLAKQAFKPVSTPVAATVASDLPYTP
ncbi:Lipopolysaccharide assembly protein A domain containing protein [Burkholderiaceae bacterium]